MTFADALDRWDRAYAALKRRDYAEYDRITGFKMPQAEAPVFPKKAPGENQ